MKKTLLFWAVLAVGLSACEKDEIDTFDSNHQMIAFRGTSSAVTFTGIEASSTATVIAEVPFRVAGYVSDTARRAVFALADDTLTTLPAGKWQVLDAIVPAGSLTGMLRIEITYPWVVDDAIEKEDLYLSLVTADGDDFFRGIENRKNRLQISEKLLKPATWFTSATNTEGLGEFSPAYYAWIIETTGLTEFPRNNPIPGVNLDANNNPQRWSDGQRRAFLVNLTIMLAQRNAAAGSPLLHDGGLMKGREVVVGWMQNDYPAI